MNLLCDFIEHYEKGEENVFNEIANASGACVGTSLNKMYMYFQISTTYIEIRENISEKTFCDIQFFFFVLLQQVTLSLKKAKSPSKNPTPKPEKAYV